MMSTVEAMVLRTIVSDLVFQNPALAPDLKIPLGCLELSLSAAKI